MGRVDNAFRNIMFGSLGNVVTTIIKFVSRTVFISFLGTTYLGVNGLYTNILTVLSLAELGIGTAMNYSLYAPVAEKDTEKLKALMKLYKKAYISIACIVAAIGLAIVPFLKFIVKDPGTITSNELIIYYLIFLFNTVSTYFVSYKYSLANANQESYIQTNINTITILITTAIQMVVLIIFKNFLLYLLTHSIIELIQKVFVSRYFNKKYNFLIDKDVEPVSKNDMDVLKLNVKALIFHKIGEVGVHQTDNIIISTFINISTVGLVSNYNLIIISIRNFISIFFNSMVAGLGNLIVTESLEKQYSIFKTYRFLGFWLYGFSAIAFYELLNPFIAIWLGNKMLLPHIVVTLIVINYYLTGERGVTNNFKNAAGIFNDDKFIPFIQAIINLILSLILVQQMGLVGIFVGTIISSLVPLLTRPYVVYKLVFGKSVLDYYRDSGKYIAAILVSVFIIETIKKFTSFDSGFYSFIVLMINVTLTTNITFYLLFNKTDQYKYLENIVKNKFSRKFAR